MNGWRDTWRETADALPSLVAKLQYARGATDVQRVSQLDADVFDAELMSLLQLQLNKMFAFKVCLSGRCSGAVYDAMCGTNNTRFCSLKRLPAHA